MSTNSNLHKAKKAKNDEFYTQLSDIERELEHYKEQFKDKIVYCNCNDPFESEFWEYFRSNYERLGIKKFMHSCYKSHDLSRFNKKQDKARAVWGEMPIDADGNGATHIFNGDGDFRSPESIELLKQADIVVTNPPFSCWIEYITQLIKYNKKFLIIGNMNAITYKEVFKLMKENKIWLGYTSPLEFMIPGGVTKKVTGLTRWFTNLDTKKRHEDLILYKKYYGNEKEYPTYDNYNAINVDKVKDIPADYEGICGVPITFMDKYNPEQFMIIGQMVTTKIDEFNHGYPYVKGKKIYARILIKKKGEVSKKEIQDLIIAADTLSTCFICLIYPKKLEICLKGWSPDNTYIIRNLIDETYATVNLNDLKAYRLKEWDKKHPAASIKDRDEYEKKFDSKLYYTFWVIPGSPPNLPAAIDDFFVYLRPRKGDKIIMDKDTRIIKHLIDRQSNLLNQQADGIRKLKLLNIKEKN